MNCQFPIAESFINFLLFKLETSSLFDFQGLINLSFEKTTTLVDDVLIKIKYLLTNEIKQEIQ